MALTCCGWSCAGFRGTPLGRALVGTCQIFACGRILARARRRSRGPTVGCAAQMQVFRREPKHKPGGAIPPMQDEGDIVGRSIDHLSECIYVSLRPDATSLPRRRLRRVPVRRMPKERVSLITNSASILGAGKSHCTLNHSASRRRSPETVLADTRQASTRATAIIFVMLILRRSRLRGRRTGNKHLSGLESDTAGLAYCNQNHH